MTLTASRQLSARPHWRYTARQAAWAVIDLVFPSVCGGCGQAGQRFCSACRASLTYLPTPLCEHCGYPLHPAESARCAACRQLGRPALTALRSIAFFEGPLRNALHRLKYRRDVILADSLALVLNNAWPNFNLPADLVIPIPLSPKRLRERGYNQAALLAQAFAELTGLAYAPQAAARIRHTDTQVGLAPYARHANVAGAFRADSKIVAGQTVILLDDVCTTGATLEACAEALLAAGATRIWGLTLGRARRPEDAAPRASAR